MHFRIIQDNFWYKQVLHNGNDLIEIIKCFDELKNLGYRNIILEDIDGNKIK